jgi:LysM repeat protein
VLLVAVVAVVTLSVHSGVLNHGAKTVASHPAAAVSHTPKAKYVYYRVRKGDTMSLIAGKYHITLGQLLVLNPRASVSTIAVGQKLKVPNIR